VDEENAYLFSREDKPGGMFPLSHLALTTMSKATGQQTSKKYFEVFPGDLPAEYTGIWAVAVGPNGSFFVVYNYRYPDDPGSSFKLALGSLKSDTLKPIPFPWNTNYVSQDAAWDGQAFVVHGFDGFGNNLQVARYGLDGAQVLPPTPIGPDGPETDGDFEYRTDPISGRSWYVSGAFDRLLLTGNDRDGTPFPKDPAGELSQFVPPIPGDCSAQVQHASLAPTSDGAFLAWVVEFGFCTQKVGLDLLPTGPLQFVHATKVPTQPVSSVLWVFGTTTQRREQDWWVGVYDVEGIWSTRTDGQSISSREMLVSYSPGQCYKTDSCQKFQGIHGGDFRHLDSLVWQDELWLGYLDATSQDKDPTHSGYRVLRVAPGCVYPSMYDVTAP
jgi:hypothetical protein